MKSRYDEKINNILNLFNNKFLIYNAVIMLLVLPITLLASATKLQIFFLIQLIELVCIVINAIYIVYKIVMRKRNI